MRKEAIIIKDWVICPDCGCKLAKKFANTKVENLEIKCHQCKELIEIYVEARRNG